MIQTSIIILSYNTKDLLNECLRSLFKHISHKDTEVIVVDNASSDGSVAMVKKEFPNVVLLENDKNLGFGAGINRGAEKAKGTYLLFLNSDAMVKDESVQKLVRFAEHTPRAGVIGGILRERDGKPQRSFGSFYTLPSVFLMLVGGDKSELWIHQQLQKKNQAMAVDWVSGGFMLVRKQIFDTINGFDEHFFMYIEDMELCYRVKKSGYSVFIVPDATVTHVGQGSSNRSFAIQHIYQGLRYFYRKHRSPLEYTLVNGLLSAKAVALIGLGTLTRNTYLKETYRKAL